VTNIKQDWFGNVRNDLLAGLVVALALIPESIASIILGLDLCTVGDMRQLPDSLPVFLLPDAPFNA